MVLGTACQCGRTAAEGDGGTTGDSGVGDAGGSGSDSGAPDGGALTDGGSDSGTLPDGGCPAPLSGTLYVDVTSAAGGNGSKACPFVTITQGLTAAGSAAATTVIVEPGTYNAAAGETFPLEVPANVTLTGDLSSVGSRAAFVIDGSGPATIGTQAINLGIHLVGELDFMTVTDTRKAASYLIGVNAGTPKLTLATLTGGSSGILVTGEVGGTGAQFDISEQCDISGATQDGIVVDPLGGAAPTLTVTQAAIHNNGNDGVRVAAAGGAGATPNIKIGYALLPACTLMKLPDACDIYCNARYGVEASPAVNTGKVSAEGNAWHNDPPTSGTAPADVSSALAVDDGCPAPANQTVCQ
jgi:hypothetical protein